MPSDADHAGGVIVVRLWWEEGPSRWSLRGRVTSTPRVERAESVSTPVADIEAILAAVGKGVEEFLADPPAPPRG